jgi:hypothetical protein
LIPDVKRLYAVAYEHFDGRKWHVGGVLHLHALDEANARFVFLQTLSPKERRGARIVAAAPVVGYFCDENGENVHA